MLSTLTVVSLINKFFQLFISSVTFKMHLQNLHYMRGVPCDRSGGTTYGTRATLGMTSNFQQHTEAPNFTYQFCYESHKKYIDLDLHTKRLLLAH